MELIRVKSEPLDLMHSLGIGYNRVVPKSALALDLKDQCTHIKEAKSELGLKYVGPLMMGLARVFDRRLDIALKEAKEILLVVRGENKMKLYQNNTKPRSHKKKKSHNSALESTRQNIEEIVACIDFLDSSNVPEEEKEEACLRAVVNKVRGGKIDNELRLEGIMPQAQDNFVEDLGAEIDLELKHHVDQMIHSPKRQSMLSMFAAAPERVDNLLLNFEFPQAVKENTEDNETEATPKKPQRKQRKREDDKKQNILVKKVDLRDGIDVNEWIKENIDVSMKPAALRYNALVAPKAFKGGDVKTFFDDLLRESVKIQYESTYYPIKPDTFANETSEEQALDQPIPFPEIALHDSGHENTVIQSKQSIPSIPPALLNTSQYEISLSNALALNVHYSEKDLIPEVQTVLDHIDSLRREKRTVSMQTVLAGRKKQEAVKWFRSVMSLVQNGLAVAKQDGLFGDIFVEEVIVD